MATLGEALRTGCWLTRERVRLAALALLIASFVGAAFLGATSDGLNDRFGRPLGTDFSSFYAAGSLARDGLPAAPFDHAAHFAREKAIFGAATPYYSFQYPPVFLLVAAALARMPYPLALALWQGVTLILYLLAIHSVLTIAVSSPLGGEGRGEGAPRYPSSHVPPHPAALRAADLSSKGRGEGGESLAGDKLWLLLGLAYPAVFINLGHGQNGFLTAGLFGFALVALDHRPLVAGILFGLLAYKPQFGLMIPLVLLATGRWRVIAAAAATVTALVLVTLYAFGPAVWQAFFASMPFTRTVLLEQGDVGWHKMQSVFSWVRMWGGPVGLAYLIQGLVTIAVATALAWLWRSDARYPLKAATLLIGSLLSTPFCLDYDLMLLAPAIAFLAADGFMRGFGPWQKTLLAALWIVPLVARSVAQATLIPLAAPAMLLAVVLLLRRAMTDAGAARTNVVLQSAP
jgi:alpha-1,2-mannosyltransferase